MENVFTNVGLEKTVLSFKVILFVALCRCFAVKVYEPRERDRRDP